MATDLNKSLNLDTLINNLDEVIKRVETLSGDLSNLTKASENAAKSTDELNKAQGDSKKIVDDLTVQEIELAKLQDQVVKSAEKLTVVQSEENEQLIRNKIALQEANKAIKDKIKAEKDNSKSLDEINKALNTQAKSINEATAQNKLLRAAVRDVDLTTEEGRKKIDEYNKAIEQNDRIITNSSDAFVKQKRNIGAYHTALNGVRKGFDNATLGAKAFLANPIGGMLQALVYLFKEFNKALNSSEEGQLALAKASGIFKGVMQALQNIIFAIAKPLISLFDDPRQAIENIKTDIQEKIFKVFDNLKTISTSLGKILKGVFTLDKNMIAEGAAEATEAAKDLYKETSITYALVQKGKEIYNDVVDVIGQASELEDGRRKQQVERNKLIVEEATLQRDIAKQRQIANDADEDTRTQLMAINKALELTQQLSSKRLADKREELRLLEAEGKLGENAIADNEEYARLQAEILKLEEQEANQLRTIQKRRESILKTLNKEAEQVQTLSGIKNEAVDAEKLGLQSIQELQNRMNEEDQAATKKSSELSKLTTDEKLNGALGLASQSADLTSQIFEDEKAAAYAKAGINIAEGITKAIASKGFLGIAQGALISASGAVQLAKIASTQYYKGTDNAKKGLAWVSERGAELIEDNKGNLRLIPDMSLVNLEGGEKVYTAQETKQIMFDDSRIIKELRRQKTNVIVNIKKDSFVSKYSLKA